MSLKHGILGFLSYGELSGYDLEKKFRSSIGYFWSVKISQVYRDLHAMEKSGWVQSKDMIQTGRPNKKIYMITDAGYQELDNWLLGYKVKNDIEVRIGILMRMFFAAKIPKQETIALLERFRTKCQEAQEKLSDVNEEIPQSDKIEMLYMQTTLSYGYKYYQMQMEWCTETIEKLRSMDGEADDK